MHRPTRDLDLLGFGDGSADGLAEVFRALGSANVADDGLTWAAATVRIEPIREDQEYGGQRDRQRAATGNPLRPGMPESSAAYL